MAGGVRKRSAPSILTMAAVRVPDEQYEPPITVAAHAQRLSDMIGFFAYSQTLSEKFLLSQDDNRRLRGELAEAQSKNTTCGLEAEQLKSTVDRLNKVSISLCGIPYDCPFANQQQISLFSLLTTNWLFLPVWPDLSIMT